jgi:hypothetical protein
MITVDAQPYIYIYILPVSNGCVESRLRIPAAADPSAFDAVPSHVVIIIPATLVQRTPIFVSLIVGEKVVCN